MKNRKANRLKAFDYSSDAFYFVTSCTQNKIHYFGEVEGGIMRLNALGEIAQKQWHWLADQYPYVALHGFVVMPNHIHGIIQINADAAVGTGRDLSVPDPDLSMPNLSLHQMECNSPERKPKIKSLSELMGAYKTTVSKEIHRIGHANFAWHRSFHDHVIRNDEGYRKIAEYIQHNPQLWADDCYFDDGSAL